VSRDRDPEGRFFEQIENEFRHGRNISHPSVVQLYALRKVRQRLRVVELGLVMEYIEGLTLERRRTTDVGELLRIFCQVAEGLGAIHRAGYVHADIKPSNVMCGPGGRVKILDLGQSCPMGAIKQRIQGTPDFMAPEQLLKMRLDERTDVFNLGATMYWCLTGKTFPTAIRTRQQTSKTLNIDMREELKTPQQLNPQIPAVFSNVVMDCCRNSPQQRPAHMDLLLEQLKAVQSLLDRRRLERI
jgi:serine/threonine-protein kinase